MKFINQSAHNCLNPAKTTGVKQLHDFTSHLKVSRTFNSLSRNDSCTNTHTCTAEYGSHTVSLSQGVWCLLWVHMKGLDSQRLWIRTWTSHTELWATLPFLGVNHLDLRMETFQKYSFQGQHFTLSLRTWAELKLYCKTRKEEMRTFGMKKRKKKPAKTKHRHTESAI